MNSGMSKDYFSKESKKYAKYRPTYPSELFDFIINLSKEKQLAWDCATGSGQSASILAEHFEQVVATDISQAQLDSAIQKSNITYVVAPAEKTNLSNNSVDLITVAQAVHWFDLPAFYKEVKRVLKPGGIIAIWAYPKSDLIEPNLNVILSDFFEMLWEKECWPWERKYVDDGYQNIPFPFKEVQVPDFYLRFEQDLNELTNYVKTWSSVAEYEKKFGKNPVDAILIPQLKPLWKDPCKREKLESKLTVKIGKI